MPTAIEPMPPNRSASRSAHCNEQLRRGPKKEGPIDDNGDVFLASIQGRRVDCRTVEDAIAVKTADTLLRSGASCPERELQRLLNVLTRYECKDAADALSQRLTRQSAAEFLTIAIGSQRPTESADVQ
jgi:hypothetical protein